ncbi:MAG: serine/threonine-protein kinase, partial [Myxococcales bacterium]|nr:serine/threonine-protein kinase [Myxococcales bacterium]
MSRSSPLPSEPPACLLETVDEVTSNWPPKAGGLGRAPTRIAGRYELEHRIGIGGMGEVFAALDVSTQQRVALKRLTERAAKRANPSALFESEFCTLAQLAHPYIVSAFDYGVTEGCPYYTMELLDGQDLAHMGPLDWREACRLLRDIGSALSLLHSRRLIHRDLTPSNVRCTTSGAPKLIDLGALVPFGITSALVGTPPFIAPEALYRQELDQRVDLYSLGVLGYWLMTGHYPYEVEQLADLEAAWRRPCDPVSHWCGPIPEPVDDLIMSLLSVDRHARPRAAAEVIEKLTALAELGTEEPGGVGRAYLAMPKLVSRETETNRFLRSLAALEEGQSSVFLVSGDQGVGRSRLLGELVLQSKLRGTLTLSVGASAAQGHFGVAGALIAELCEVAPDAADRLPQDLRELPDTRRHAAPPGPDDGLGREQLHIQLRDWWQAEARRRPMFIAIDDLHLVDEASAAFIAALAHGLVAAGAPAPGVAKPTMIVAATTVPDATPHDAPRKVYARAAIPMPLAPLSAGAVQALLGSIFGDTPRLEALSALIHASAQGNPQVTLELAQELVDESVLRYERGNWLVPQRLSSLTFGASFAYRFSERIARLDGHARELAEGLALVARTPVSVDAYPTLTAHQDRATTLRALDALIVAG